MARAALKLSVRELAKNADCTANTISRVEGGAEALASTIDAIQVALEKAGAEFLGDGGVRLRPKPPRRGSHD